MVPIRLFQAGHPAIYNAVPNPLDPNRNTVDGVVFDTFARVLTGTGSAAQALSRAISHERQHHIFMTNLSPNDRIDEWVTVYPDDQHLIPPEVKDDRHHETYRTMLVFPAVLHYKKEQEFMKCKGYIFLHGSGFMFTNMYAQLGIKIASGLDDMAYQEQMPYLIPCNEYCAFNALLHRSHRIHRSMSPLMTFDMPEKDHTSW